MDQTVAQAFKLRAYQDVIVNIVDPKVRRCDSSASPPFVSRTESLIVFYLIGRYTGPGGADFQGPVHRQRGHVETEEESGGACEGLHIWL